jgi:hypothetical protein
MATGALRYAGLFLSRITQIDRGFHRLIIADYTDRSQISQIPLIFITDYTD